MDDYTSDVRGQTGLERLGFARLAEQFSQYTSGLIELRRRELALLEGLNAQLQMLGGAGVSFLPPPSVAPSRAERPTSVLPETDRPSVGVEECVAISPLPVACRAAEQVVQVFEAYCEAFTGQPNSIREVRAFVDFIKRMRLPFSVVEVYRDANVLTPYDLYRERSPDRVSQIYWLVEGAGEPIVLPAPSSPDEFDGLTIYDRSASELFKPRDYLDIVPPEVETLPTGVVRVKKNGKIRWASGARPPAPQMEEVRPDAAGAGPSAPAGVQGERDAENGYAPTVATAQNGAERERMAFFEAVGRVFVDFCADFGSVFRVEPLQLFKRCLQNAGLDASVDYEENKTLFKVVDAHDTNARAYCPVPRADGTFDPGWSASFVGIEQVTVRNIKTFFPYVDVKLPGAMSGADPVRAVAGAGVRGAPFPEQQQGPSLSVEEEIVEAFNDSLGEGGTRERGFIAALNIRLKGIGFVFKGMINVESAVYVDARTRWNNTAETAWLVQILGQSGAWLLPVFRNGSLLTTDAFEVVAEERAAEQGVLLVPALVELDRSRGGDAIRGRWRVRQDGKGKVCVKPKTGVAKVFGSIRGKC